MLIREMLDTDMLRDDIERGLIRIAKSEHDPDLIILCYTPATQYSCAWDDVTRACRGISARKNPENPDLGEATVLARGIPKFFTMSDAAKGKGDNFVVSLEDDDEQVAQLEGLTVSLDSHVTCADKLDGAMCIGYVHDGRLRVHTKGSFQSDEAKVANRIIDTRYDARAMAAHMPEHERGLTPVFEVVTPLFPHVVDYGSTEEIFLLGWVELETGIWHPVRPDDDFAVEFGLPMPETILDGTFAEMLALPPRPGKEGIVVTVDVEPQRMIKVKYEEFLTMQRLAHGLKASDIEQCAMRLLVLTSDWATPLTDQFDPSRMSAHHKRYVVGVDEESPIADHILDAHIRASLRLAADAKHDFDEALEQTLTTWGLANGYRLSGLDDNDAFVSAVLNHAPRELRNVIFSTKRLYLSAESDNVEKYLREIALECAQCAVAKTLKRQKGMSRS